MRRLILAALFLPALLVSTPAAAAIIVPNSLAAVEGSSNNGYPFSLATFGDTSMRYQQVYDDSQFSGPLLITGISFRPDGGTGNAFASTLSDIQINLSTTSAAVDGLSTTFATNVGADDTIVYARGPLSLSSADTGAGPRDFDISILFTTAFLYNPALGNLLLDVRNFGGGGSTQFDAHAAGDSISRVYALSVGATTATTFDTVGLVTQFDTASPVPEPATCVLVGVGLLGAASRRFRRKTL